MRGFSIALRPTHQPHFKIVPLTHKVTANTFHKVTMCVGRLRWLRYSTQGEGSNHIEIIKSFQPYRNKIQDIYGMNIQEHRFRIPTNLVPLLIRREEYEVGSAINRIGKLDQGTRDVRVSDFSLTFTQYHYEITSFHSSSGTTIPKHKKTIFLSRSVWGIFNSRSTRLHLIFIPCSKWNIY